MNGVPITKEGEKILCFSLVPMPYYRDDFSMKFVKLKLHDLSLVCGSFKVSEGLYQSVL